MPLYFPMPWVLLNPITSWLSEVTTILNFLVSLLFFVVTPHYHIYTTTTTKSLQSCPTLCDPIDGSPPGSAIPGILQARTLEWVAISFSNEGKWNVKVKSLSRVRLFTTPWTVAYQVPPSMGLSRPRVLEWGAIAFSVPHIYVSLNNKSLNFMSFWISYKLSHIYMYASVTFVFLLNVMALRLTCVVVYSWVLFIFIVVFNLLFGLNFICPLVDEYVGY